MQLFQVVIFISHYDSSCWFLSHSSFFKGEGAVFILKKRECIASWDRVLITAAAWCIIIMIHFNSRQQNHHGFYSFFYALIILLIHCPFSFNRNKGGFFFKTNRGLEMDSPTSAAIYDSLLWCRWRWWQQSFFQSTRIASLFWCIFISISSWCTLSLKENGISSWSASLFWCISSIYCIIFLMHSFSFLWNKQRWVIFLHHLCDSFLLDFASLLWCISSYFNENTTHLSDSLYLILHHISDASFSFKVNRGCYFIIFLMQFYSLRWDWLIYHGITVFFNGSRGQQVKSYDSYLFEWGWFLLKEWDGFIVRKQNDRTVFLNENNCLL